MGKNDLIGGSLWDNYSHKVADHMNNPKNLGEITKEEADSLNAKLIVAEYGAESCGDAVRLFWAVERDSGIIVKATFKSFGCGTAIASSDMMADLCLGKTVDEAVQITNIDVETALRDDPNTPAVPPQKMHCSVMAYDVIKEAAAIYKGVDRSTMEDEELVCECARVTLKTIQEVIKINDLKTVQEITDYTKAGAFCKSCVKPGGHEKRKFYLEDILKETRAKMDSEKKKEASFEEMSLFQKGKVLENFFDAEIRPMLKKDGGNVEIMDLSEKDDKTVVTISYLGACLGCASSLSGTFNAIEMIIQNKLNEKIEVIVQQ
ncbi:MAG: iron-sulfur cluster assembly scaffold protein [Spirochaetaceae bacterium]|jgi:NifU-like protein|nr:iron-sulfur cluster assembly scaffold protein [Spirochaetaceae bacterium]